MSGGRFLGSAVAAREGSYFLQQSKNAVGNLISRKRLSPSDAPYSPPPAPPADVLPEVLRHSLPLSPPPSCSPPSSSLSRWSVPTPSRPPRASPNPISALISLPQVTFGPRRWELPQPGHQFTASTANELRVDRYDSHVSSERMRAAAGGLAQVGKAFIVATVLVFGGATCAFVGLISSLHIQTSDDLRVKARDVLQPRVEKFKDYAVPLQVWVGSMSRKRQIEDVREKSMVKELSKRLGGKSST